MRFVAGTRGIMFSEALAADGAVVFAKACELGLEGIVSKREGSFYRWGDKGERHIWLAPETVNKLRHLRGPGESYSDVILRIAAGERCS